MIKVFILVCALGLDRGACQPDTARAVLNGPDADNPVACMFTGQAYIANSAIEVGEDEYVKVQCRLPSDARTVAQRPTSD